MPSLLEPVAASSKELRSIAEEDDEAEELARLDKSELSEETELIE
jgi:hypothetical protein